MVTFTGGWLQLSQCALPGFLQFGQICIEHGRAGETSYCQGRLFRHHADRGKTVAAQKSFEPVAMFRMYRDQMSRGRLGEEQRQVVPAGLITLPEHPGEIQAETKTARKGRFSSRHSQTAVGQ